jgi:hypothetical protein
MTDPTAARAFLIGEVEGLGPFDLVALSPAGKPLHAVEVTRTEAQALEVRVPGRPPILEELPVPIRSALRDRGFASEDPDDQTRPWVHTASDAEAAVTLAQKVLAEVFGEKSDARFDLIHGSHRAEHEAREKLAIVRERIQRIVTEEFDKTPEQDSDGDFVLPVGDVHVMLAPRAAAGGPVVVRIFAVTNVEITVSPELGLFLARLNFGLMFGRFALDAEHHAIWFDETLLGDHFNDEELRFAIGVVASTADEWDDRLKQLFGGSTYQEVLTKRGGPQSTPTLKPGQGGYI